MEKPQVLKGAAEIGAFMGVSRRTVFRYINHWDLPAVKMPSGVLITSTWLLASWHKAMQLYKAENGLHAYKGFSNI